MKFLVIDNQGGELDNLIYILKQCYDGQIIAPELGETTSRWSEAETLVTTKATDEMEQIIFLDLALDLDSSSDAKAGLERVRNLVTRRPNATWIAYTSFYDVLDSHEARKLIHALLNKQHMSGRSEEELQLLVRGTVEEALRKRRGIAKPTVIQHEDSSGMRSFFAVYPEGVLEELVAAECADWTERRVRALSSGYSGSSLLEINGRKDSASRQIVVKLAPRKKMIEEEAGILNKRFRGEGGVFVGRCAQSSVPKPLSDQLGFYSIQDMVLGNTLMSLMVSSSSTNPEAQEAISTIIELAIEQYKKGWFNDGSDIDKKLQRFVFSEVDLDRARQACEFLLDLANGMQDRNTWPGNAMPPTELFAKINSLLENWRAHLENTNPFRWVLQHGDLNPHNVMVGAGDQITFIDLARLGHWPIGYDLSRLAIQLRIRLVDQAQRLDWFEDRLGLWCDEWLWAPNIPRAPASSLCPPAVLCDVAMYDLIQTSEPAVKNSLMVGTRVGALYDLLRILSYSDLSPFKRLWAAINCFEQAERLGWNMY